MYIYIYLYLKFHQYVIVCQLQKVLDLQRPPTTEIPWLLQNMSRKSSYNNQLRDFEVLNNHLLVNKLLCSCQLSIHWYTDLYF